MALRKWAFEKVCKECLDALHQGRRLTSEVETFRGLPQNADPMSITTSLEFLRTSRFCEALVLLGYDRHDEAWLRLHLCWRYDLFVEKVLISARERLILDRPKEARFGTLPLQKIDCFDVISLTMAIAFSAALGEDEIADWFGKSCLKLLNNPPLGMKINAFSVGPVAPWILSMYCMWRKQPIDLAAKGVQLKGPFASSLENWENQTAFEADVLQLCELHAKKAANRQVADNDMVFGLESDYPVEILFLLRIRRELGLSVPAPNHPLLNSPLATAPFPCPKSGFDPILDEAYHSCQRQLPGFRIEWEEEFQKLGPSDPRTLPLTDLDIVRAK